MELYNSNEMPLSNNPELRNVQERFSRGEKFFTTFGRDQHRIIKKIGNYECKPDHCYRAISLETLELYKQYGYVKDKRRTEFQAGINNQGIDWYLGGAAPGNLYGNIVIECPADKQYFQPANDNGCTMTLDSSVRHMKSSPQENPIPITMITNVFDYSKIKEQEMQAEAIIEAMANNQIDTNGQPIISNQQEQHNAYTRTMGFTGTNLLALVSFITSFIIAIVGIVFLIFK